MTNQENSILLKKLDSSDVIILKFLLKIAQEGKAVTGKFLWKKCGGEEVFKVTYRGISKKLVKLEKLDLVGRRYTEMQLLSDRYSRAYWYITDKGKAFCQLVLLLPLVNQE